MYKVVHLIRKQGQIKASFIRNQILHNNLFFPSVYYLSPISSGGFAEDDNKIDIFPISSRLSSYDIILYKFFKKMSPILKEDLLNHIVSLSPAILHFHYGTDAGIYLKTLRMINIPKVVSFYGYDCSGFPKRFLGYGKIYLRTRVFKYATKVLAMSEDMKNDLMNLGCPSGKIIVHYHGVPTSLFFQEHNYLQSTKVVSFLIITGLTPQKGHLFLIKAFIKAHNILPNIKLSIYGSGSEAKSISDEINDSNVSSYIQLFSSIQYGSEQHKSLLRNADVFIHPSITDRKGNKEGIPGAIVEAMSAGLPVISTFHAGIPEIINDGETGLLVKENDVDSLADKIVLMASSPTLREKLGKAGQEYAVNNLDIENKEKELEEIYLSLIN